MTTQIKRRRGTTTQHASFTGAEGELTIDTTKDTVVVHDGTTSGGHPLAKESAITGKVDKAGDTMTGDLALSGADVTFGDNDKAIFGAGSDLQIYHDGASSIIADAGSGNLQIRANDFQLLNAAGSQNIIRGYDATGAVGLHYGGSEKLATTSTGIDVTGNVTMATGGSIVAGGVNDLVLNAGESGTPDIYLQSGSSTKVKIEGSNGNVGIGTNSPDLVGSTTALTINHSGGNGQLSLMGNGTVYGRIFADNATGDLKMGNPTSNDVMFYTANLERMRITSAGSVGIGTSSVASGTLNVVQGTSSALTVLSQSSATGDGTTSNTAIRSTNLTGSGWANTRYDAYTHTWGIGGSASANSAMTLDSSGNVGIGLSSGISSKLHVNTEMSVGADGDNRGIVGYTPNRFYIGTRQGGVNYFNTVSVSAGSVGIGTSSPTNTSGLEIQTSSTTAGLWVQTGGTTSSYNIAEFRTGSNLDALKIRGDGSSIFKGNVGIGTSSPRVALDVDGEVAIAYNANYGIRFYNQPNNNWSSIGNTHTSSGANLVFKDASGEAFRLDGSGNLLVGTTVLTDINSSGTGNEGAFIQSYGHLGIAVSNDKTATFNRKTSDGDILEFRKNGSTVGSIGSRAGVVSYIALDPRSGGAGLTGGQALIYPSNNTGGITDGATDLGGSGGRFKDLYISGGVFLGGTGSANKLDDVETGTWTPNVIGASSAGTTTYSASGAYGGYTKIGNLVTLTFYVSWTAMTGSGNLRITGMPFALAGNTSNDVSAGNCMTSDLNIPNGTNNLTLVGTNGDTYLRIFSSIDAGGLQQVQCDAGGATVWGQFTYRT